MIRMLRSIAALYFSLTILSGCSFEANITKGSRASDSGGNSNPSVPQIAAPSGILLKAPGVSPSAETHPTIVIDGVSPGYQVSIFSDSLCTNLVESLVATQSTIEITLTDALAEGLYVLYSQAEHDGIKSSCSTAYLTYIVDITPSILSVAKAYQTLSEGSGASSLAINLSVAKPYPITIDFSLVGTTADLVSLISLPTRTIVIPANSTTSSISFDVLNDGLSLGEKTLQINLERTNGATIKIEGNSQSKIDISDAQSTYGLPTAMAGNSGYGGNGLTFCAIISGALKCVGYNSNGQLGDGTTINKTSAIVVDSGTSYASIATGAGSTCAVTTGNVLKCWGANSFGQLGDGTIIDKASPVIVDSGQSYTTVSAGSGSACAIATSGDLKCWGANSSGQLGDGTTVNKSTPVPIDSGVSYATLSAGTSHACAITVTGDLKCWGNNGSGQLGDGSVITKTSPAMIDGPTKYSKVSAGNSKTCAITVAGDLKCWGLNIIGDGTENPSSIPIVIDSGVHYSDISVGPKHTCGLTSTGEMKCWGYNDSHQVSTTLTSNNVLSPIIVNSGVTYAKVLAFGASGGGNVSCGITTDGKTRCGGAMVYLLGTNDTPTVFDAETTYASIGKTLVSAMHLVTSSGQVKAMGYNSYGGLGDGTMISRSAPIGISIEAAPNQISSVSHSCYISSTGVLACTGFNFAGQIGNGTTIDQVAYTEIDSGTLYSDIDLGYDHTCGVTVGGTLKCWGGNSDGQLGDGTTAAQLVPKIIDSVESYTQVDVGYHQSCAITTAGVLKCWGRNNRGQVGDGTGVVKLIPTVIDSGVAYKTVAVGSQYTCGITTTDALKCWGRNFFGQLGDGTLINRFVPTLIDSGVSYKSVSTSTDTTCGITSLDVLKCWGSAPLGDGGSASYQMLPVVVDGSTTYKQVSVGNSCALTTSGILKCWNNANWYSPVWVKISGLEGP